MNLKIYSILLIGLFLQEIVPSLPPIFQKMGKLRAVALR